MNRYDEMSTEHFPPMGAVAATRNNSKISVRLNPGNFGSVTLEALMTKKKLFFGTFLRDTFTPLSRGPR